MSRPLLISIAGLGLVVFLAAIVWLYLRRRRKVEASVALAAVAVMVSAVVPLLAKPVEDAWTPITTPGGQATSAPPTPVPPPGEVKDVLRPGWGPAREMFSMTTPASFVTLNSISDNPEVGDERVFYIVRPANANCTEASAPWQIHEKVRDGDHLLFRIYVENSVADNLDRDGSHTVHGLRVKVNLPSEIGDAKTGSAGQAESSAVLSTDNATPREYWHIVLLSSERAVRLEVMPGTAKLHNNHFGKNGLPLSDSFLYRPGMLLGYDQLDGNLRAGYQYALYMVFCVKVTAVRT